MQRRHGYRLGIDKGHAARAEVIDQSFEVVHLEGYVIHDARRPWGQAGMDQFEPARGADTHEDDFFVAKPQLLRDLEAKCLFVKRNGPLEVRHIHASMVQPDQCHRAQPSALFTCYPPPQPPWLERGILR